MCVATAPQKGAESGTGDNANWMAHSANSTAASHHASSMLMRNRAPTSDWPSVMRSSSSCCESKEMVAGAPLLAEKTMASMATSRVHWLMLLETMFISAMGARSTVRAQ